MAKKMKTIALFSTMLTLLCTSLYIYIQTDMLFALAITFGTTSYHFLMRLTVGTVINLLFDNHIDYQIRWFQVSAIEQKLYKKLGVKKWKNKMPTYAPNCFDKKNHSWDEIVQAMCQAELVHEVIIVLSFVPIFAAISFGAFPIFLGTSVLAACFDALFVVMQRYNRPRIIKLMKIPDRNESKKIG